ncbi:MAG TPA: hypothetical protein PKA20_16020 [Burkholderiaceae bacterium]|nr:hypothetical protein [Burkholderiaceae bacterium]
MKWNRATRNRLANARRLTIRRHVPWPLRVLSLVVAGALGAVAALAGWHLWFAQESHERAAVLQTEAAELRERVEDLQDKLTAVLDERARLALIANSADSQVKVEQSATERLAAQLRLLEAENGKLKADLAYLESLLPAPEVTGEGAVAIRRFQVEAGDAPNQLHYRALLAQGGRAEREFSGSFQLVVAAESMLGKAANWTWPEAGSADARDRTRLHFKRFQRVEGSVDVPVGVRVRSVQLRVLERGVVRAQQSATP